MRKLSFNRPNEKIRNPDRHLRSLKRWADGFLDYYPKRTDSRYVNFKIWTLDRLIEGPKSKHEWKKEAIRQLLSAADNLVNAKPDAEKGKSWVAVLLCYPNLWASEVTVFFDKDYLNSFIPSKTVNKSLLKNFGISTPNNFIEVGYFVSWDDEDENGICITFNEERFTIFEKSK